MQRTICSAIAMAALTGLGACSNDHDHRRASTDNDALQGDRYASDQYARSADIQGRYDQNRWTQNSGDRYLANRDAVRYDANGVDINHPGPDYSRERNYGFEGDYNGMGQEAYLQRRADQDRYVSGQDTMRGDRYASGQDMDRGDWRQRTDSNQAMADRTTMDPDARILSILHAKNQEEIEIGRLAKQKGMSSEAKRFGDELVDDHSKNDDQVMSVARSQGIRLMDPDQVKWMLLREKGIKDNTPPQDAAAMLRSVQGVEFDRTLSQKMAEGHQELISIVQDARGKVRNDEVRKLLDKTLPTLKEHASMADHVMHK